MKHTLKCLKGCGADVFVSLHKVEMASILFVLGCLSSVKMHYLLSNVEVH